jgi:hypothetical protein
MAAGIHGRDEGVIAEVTDRTPEARERRRAKALAAIPRWYNPWVHLGLTTAVGVAVWVIGVLRLHAISWRDWITVPLVLIASNAFEWRAHRDLLHRRRTPFQVLYDRHTPVHHVVYTYDDMAIRSTRELRLVLIPAAGVAGVVLATAPAAFAISRFFGSNAGWLMLMTSAFYVVAYEWSHMSYHLPAESFVGRRRLVRLLREHHARHHHPQLMQRWNFNVTVPLWDWVKGTVARGEALESARINPEKETVSAGSR